MKIILSGGGTLGPVAPLLAIAEVLRQKNNEVEFIWIGTKNGPEKDLVEKYGLIFKTISSAKFRRYFSLWNIVDLFKFITAFFQAFFLLLKEKPDLLISAGGFVSVPMHLSGFLLGIPGWIHQQDFRPGLANKIMSPLAQKITVALEDNLVHFSASKTEWIGNPVRSLQVENLALSAQKFKVNLQNPIILAMGGGTGSAQINKLILEALPQLPANWQVIHLVGRERPKDLSIKAVEVFKNYHPYEFLAEEMKDAYALADLVVSRAGFATISEVSSLKKPLIILPMSGTHQEDNANFLLEKQAVLTLDERIATGSELAVKIKENILNQAESKKMGERLGQILPPADPEKIREIVNSLVR